MVNPDGVYYGKSRHSLARVDLNRTFHDTSASLHPTVFHMKTLFDKSDMRMFCDFHGHSTKHNVFAFGCIPAPRRGSRTSSICSTLSAVSTDKEEKGDTEELIDLNQPRQFVEFLDKGSDLFSVLKRLQVGHRQVAYSYIVPGNKS
eukprot:CAMPEP_0203785092 /NCGR_PEP_ID=MMETSP0100_2-20121128/832_1 /ASSEMBLY_ACC=CAM_ASM_000210 /TAXON_ID=96639 /ORGANISM=" , Strain NY0313808BC1" /LENGTH=145 /DNA_ID=CAMNT_0050687151 /DNA_START=530 /DNA_END=967 /DNA_ORIENTATION=+